VSTHLVGEWKLDQLRLSGGSLEWLLVVDCGRLRLLRVDHEALVEGRVVMQWLRNHNAVKR